MAQEGVESAAQTKPPPPPLPPGLSIWPPSQRTRDAVVRRLVETLITPSSVLSKRFGVTPAPDAESAAQAIEQEALAAVSTEGSTESVEEGLKALNLYSKQVSEGLLSFSKSRVAKEENVPPPPPPPANGEESGTTTTKDDEEDSGSVVNSESAASA